MAVVYLARDLKHDRLVALKVLRPELAASIGAERFLREIQIAAKLTHTNILPLHDSGEADGHLYYVMPYVEGESLRGRLNRETQLGFDDVLQITREVAGALSHAHDQGIVHRDIKPDNVLLSEGHAVVTDFGIARAVTAAGGEQLTETGMAVGTPAYMSPEQAGGTGKIDGRSDVYALACVVYEMLAGDPPFTASTPQAVLARQVVDTVPSLRAVRRTVSESMELVLEKALAKAPADRYDTAAQFVAELEQAYTGELTLTRPKGRPWFLQPAAWGGAVAVLAVVGTIFAGPPIIDAVRNRGAVADPDRIAVMPFSVRGDEDLAYLGEGMVEMLSTKLDGAGTLVAVNPHALLVRVAREDLPTNELDPPQAEAIALEFGAGRYVLGSVVGAGGRVQAQGSLYGVDGELIATAEAVVEEESEIFDLVDELARQLLGELPGGPSDRLARIAATTTGSLPALKAYLQGEALYRVGQFDSAVAAYQRAVQADTTFALGYYALVKSASASARYNIDVRATAERAAQYSNRLAPRDRRIVQGARAQLLNDATEAENLYRAVLAVHPDDVEAWAQLGGVLGDFNAKRGQPLEDAWAALERATTLDSNHIHAIIQQIKVAWYEGDHERAVQLNERLLPLTPEGDFAAQIRATVAYGRDDVEAQRRALAELRTKDDPAIRMAAGALGGIGDLAGAIAVARIATEASRSPTMRAWGHQAIARFELRGGRWNAAQQELDAAEVLAPGSTLSQRTFHTLSPLLAVSRVELEALRDMLRTAATSDLWKVFALGIIEARLGSPDGTGQHIEELERRAADSEASEQGRALARDLALAVRAQLAWTAGRPEQALEYLERTRPEDWWMRLPFGEFDCHGLERWVRAEALAAVGRHEEALHWYVTGGLGCTGYKSPKHLRMGEVLEEMGQRDRAAWHYEKFVDAWRDSDPELRHWVERAERGLARVTAQGGGS
jgi:serine/threonine-protein kinase